MEWLQKLNLLLGRARFHREMEEELTFHFDELVKGLEEQGVSPDEARRQARLRFGNVDSIEERTHSSALFAWESVVHDLRYAFRVLKRNRTLTAVVVLSLALGIGANVSIFTVMNAVMLQLLPVREPEQLVVITSAVQPGFFPENYIHDYEGSSYVDQKTGLNVQSSVSTQTYELINKENTVFDQTFAFAANDEDVNVGLEGRAAPAKVQAVSGNFFEGLGVVPILGRVMAPYDDDAPASSVAVVSYKFWVDQLGADRAVVGKKITINDTPTEIVGVAPAEFFGVDPSVAPDFWLPLSFYRAQWMRHAGPDEDLNDHFVWWLTVVGRLKRQITRLEANAELSVLFSRSIGAQAGRSGDPKIPALRLQDARTGLNQLRLSFSKSLWLLMAMVGVVLLIACANVAALLLARATARQREIATRMSLGARRGRVMRQLLTESIVLSLYGGLVGLVLAHWITKFLVALLDRRRDSIGLNIHMDTRVLAFATVISIGGGLLFGLAPAMRATSAGIVPMLKQTGALSSIAGRQFRFGKLLIGTQVALCVLLLVTAGLLVRTLKSLQNVDLGFNKNRVATFVVRPGMNGYKDREVVSYYQELTRRLQSLPGVHSVTYAQFGPIGEGRTSSETYVPGYNSPEKKAEYHRHVVGEDYFTTLQIPVLMGRALGPQDTRTAKHVVVINETAVKNIFHGDNPIGRVMVMGSLKEPNPSEVVGVVRDVRYAHVRDDVPPTVYFPIEQMKFIPGQASFLLRGDSDPKLLFRDISTTALGLNPNVPVVKLKTEDTLVSQNLYMEQTFALLSSGFAAVGLLLACVGLYGTIAYTVVQRTKEIGVRIALGAAREKIVSMVLGEALVVVAWGLALGVAAAWLSTGLLKSQLYGLSPHDSWTITVAMVCILVVTLAAGFVPARKASRIDPMVALRYE